MMKYLHGFDRAISGGGFNYHGPHPAITKSMLVRHKSGENIISWSTEVVPEYHDGTHVSFLWYFAIDHNAGETPFDLSINGESNLRFTNERGSQPGSWSVPGAQGTELQFNATMIDKYSDLMGIATLRIPLTLIKRGEAVVLSVTAGDSGKTNWYMTYEGRVSPETVLSQSALVARDGDSRSVLLHLTMVHLEPETGLEIRLSSGPVMHETVRTGYNLFTIPVPEALVGSEISAEIRAGDGEVAIRRIRLEAVREWIVYLVMHTHTDIGYTRAQTEILPEHLRYIDYALDFCDLTDSYPDAAKFRWTCESSWPVLEYLKARPREQLERLKSRVAEGRIELTAMMFNLSEMADEALLAGMLSPLKQIRDAGLTVESAMQNDINGIGWCFVDFFRQTGINYLVMGEHGHRALIPFDYPTLFWWQSRSGQRVLAYRADHYMTGNVIGVHTGNLAMTTVNLLDYLDKLSAAGYPRDDVHIQMSGYITDNAPPSLAACDLVQQWNEKYEWPKLRIATASEFIRKAARKNPESLPGYRAAWPDWWADGFGTAARETAESRRVQGELNANGALLAMAKLLGAALPPDTANQISAVQQDLLFYAEHTFGYSESVREPMSEQTHVQWLEKASFIWQATKNSRMLTEKAMGFIQSYLPQFEQPAIALFNTLNWTRSGLAELYIDHQIIPENSAFKLIDPAGNETTAQRLRSRSDGSYWGVWADAIPPFGYKMYRIVPGAAQPAVPEPTGPETVLENSYYRIECDSASGTISGIVDIESGLNLVDPAADYRFGQVIYEQLSNRAQLERFRLEDEPRRTVPVEISGPHRSGGTVWESIRFSGKLPVCADEQGVTIEIRLYRHSKKIEMVYSMVKLPVIQPESLYVAFPFALAGARIVFEAQGGMVEPGVDQIPGTSTDWNVIQHYAAVENENHHITFTSNEIPLVQFGAINIGRFESPARPATSHIYSWVMNNYWVTNFRASQDGEFTWRYFLTSGEKQRDSDQYRFGLGLRTPFLSRVLPPGNTPAKKAVNSLLHLEYPNLVIIAAKPLENTDDILLQVKEVDGMGTMLPAADLRASSGRTVFLSDLSGDSRLEAENIQIPPYGTVFIRIGV
jgi:alpha-mannosidase